MKPNRHQRRAVAARNCAAGDVDRRLNAEVRAEAKVAAAASKLTPAEARKALAEWAARGGKPQGGDDGRG